MVGDLLPWATGNRGHSYETWCWSFQFHLLYDISYTYIYFINGIRTKKPSVKAGGLRKLHISFNVSICEIKGNY